MFPQKRLAAIIISFVFITMIFLQTQVSAEDNDNVPEYLERDLAEQYAPILYLHPDVFVQGARPPNGVPLADCQSVSASVAVKPHARDRAFLHLKMRHTRK